MSEETKGIWGRSRSSKSKYVHFYVNGVAICGQGPRMDLVKEDWDPADKCTCSKCRELHQWFEKGFRQVTDPTQDQ